MSQEDTPDDFGPKQAPAESDTPKQAPAESDTPKQAPAESDTPKQAPTESDIPKQAPAESDAPENNEENQLKTMTNDELIQLINEQNSKLNNYEEKFKRARADFDNLQKKTVSNIKTEVDNQTDKLFLDFLQIYDDFLRAKDVYATNNVDIKGLDSILKNMNSILSRYNVTQIEALGEIFDPNLHEAISIILDPELDDNTITKELRKGYASHNRVIRPTLVEVSKRSE